MSSTTPPSARLLRSAAWLMGAALLLAGVLTIAEAVGVGAEAIASALIGGLPKATAHPHSIVARMSTAVVGAGVVLFGLVLIRVARPPDAPEPASRTRRRPR